MNPDGLVCKHGLEDSDAAQVKELERVCNQAEGTQVKLNWSMRQTRDPDQTDYCYYQDGKLVGYMPFDCFGQKVEITAIVAPEYRRQGIFRQMYEAARQEASRRDLTEFLLVSYPVSEAGSAVVKRLNVTYQCSEYRMEADAAQMPPLPESSLTLVRVTEEHIPELARLIGLSFGEDNWNVADELRKRMNQPEEGRYYLAQRQGTWIGQIGVVAGDNGTYIRAVGIAPEWRRQGFGRQLLSATLQEMLAEGHTYFELDVETQNGQALSLYESCGFRQKLVYDYYRIPLA